MKENPRNLHGQASEPAIMAFIRFIATAIRHSFIRFMAKVIQHLIIPFYGREGSRETRLLRSQISQDLRNLYHEDMAMWRRG